MSGMQFVYNVFIILLLIHYLYLYYLYIFTAHNCMCVIHTTYLLCSDKATANTLHIYYCKTYYFLEGIVYFEINF